MNGRSSIVTSDFFVADVKKYLKSSCRTHRVPPSFEIGEDVIVIPYSKNTVIVREDTFFIEFDTCGVANKTVGKNGEKGKVITFPYVEEDKVLICKKEFDVFSRIECDNFSFGTIRSRNRGSYFRTKEDEGSKLLFLPYVKDITTIDELGDGNVRIESFSDMIAIKTVTPSGTISFDKDWGELDIVYVKL